VIGGGDTGSDCIGTSNRHGALSVTQLEIMPEPPLRKTSCCVAGLAAQAAHLIFQAEGCERDFAVQTRRAIGADGKITGLECVRVEWSW